MIGPRSIVWVRATAALVAGTLVLAIDGSPGRGSPEVGYLHDMLTHDENALAALGVLALGDLTPSENAMFTELDGLIRGSNEQARMLLAEWGLPADERDRPIVWMGHFVPGATPGQMGETVANIERWFVERNEVPPTWLAYMTADPGELDHGDPSGSLADLLSSAVEWVALSCGVFGLLWLAMRENSSATTTRRLCALAAGFSALSGLGHLGLARSHFEQAAISGLFFVVVGLAGIVFAAALVARPSVFAADNADDPILGDLAATVARNQRIEISEYDSMMKGLGYETSPGSLSMSELAVLSLLASQT